MIVVAIIVWGNVMCVTLRRLLTGFIVVVLNVSMYACGITSNGIDPTQAAKFGPFHPTQVIVELRNGSKVVRWRGTGANITHYQIYHHTGAGGTWQLVGTVPEQGDNRGWYTWNDPISPRTGVDVYGVVAFDSSAQSMMRTSDKCVIDLFDQPNEYKLCDGN
jgi:hypothetical protein